MATDNPGPDGTSEEPSVEGSWSPRRSKPTAKKASDDAAGKNGKAKSSDPEVLAEEIEKTREELAETLDAIAEKVSPKRVTARTKKKVGGAAAGAVDSVKESAGHAADAVKGAAGKAKASTTDGEPPLSVAEVPVEVAPTPGALADTAVTSEEPAGAETPLWTTTLPPQSPSRLPVYAGAGAALVVLLLILRRRRR